MASLSEIQERRRSIKDTMKITNAMYMISTTKLRKAKEALNNTEPYFNKLDDIIASVLTHAPHISHEVFGDVAHIPQEQRRRGFVVITADKGLAGAYNHNVLKLAEQALREPNKGYKLYIVGNIGENYFHRRSYHNIEETFHYTAQNPSLSRARRIASTLIESFESNELDEIFLIYTRMMSATEMEPVITRILPLSREDYDEDGTYSDIPMFPSPEAVLSSVAPLCVTGYIYSALIESYCCEQNARVNAMQAATDAGTEMLHELSIQYNRVRQARITQEITEVAAGAKALKRTK